MTDREDLTAEERRLLRKRERARARALRYYRRNRDEINEKRRAQYEATKVVVAEIERGQE